MKIAIFGDIGGHAELYKKALINLNVDIQRCIIPPDLTIIQVGDLIDRGPDSAGVVDLVSRFIQNPQYIQLIGNHESKHLGGPLFWENNKTAKVADELTIKTIVTWQNAGLLSLSAAVKDDNDNSYLISHSGLSAIKYEAYHRDITDVGILSQRINDANDLRAGYLLGERPGDAGVTWADAYREVILTWAQRGLEPPFNQIHGHSTIYDWNRGQLRIPNDWSDKVTVDKDKRQTKFWLGEKFIAQIDSGLGQYSQKTPSPFIIESGTIV